MDPIYFQTYQYYQARQKEVSDPTTLIVVDEADRLQMNSLEQVRSVFERRYGHPFGRYYFDLNRIQQDPARERDNP